MRKLSEKGRKILRAVFRVLGVTAVSLVFQACYGPPPVRRADVTIHGSAKSKTTNAPIMGINVSIENTSIRHLTSNDGNFYLYLPRPDIYTVIFEDIDGPANGGKFKPHSIEVDMYENQSPLKLQVELEEVDE